MQVTIISILFSIGFGVLIALALVLKYELRMLKASQERDRAQIYNSYRTLDTLWGQFSQSVWGGSTELQRKYSSLVRVPVDLDTAKFLDEEYPKAEFRLCLHRILQELRTTGGDLIAMGIESKFGTALHCVVRTSPHMPIPQLMERTGRPLYPQIILHEQRDHESSHPSQKSIRADRAEPRQERLSEG